MHVRKGERPPPRRDSAGVRVFVRAGERNNRRSYFLDLVWPGARCGPVTCIHIRGSTLPRGVTLRTERERGREGMFIIVIRVRGRERRVQAV